MRDFKRPAIICSILGVVIFLLYIIIYIKSQGEVSVTSEYPPMVKYNDNIYTATLFNEKKIAGNQSLVQVAVIESCIGYGVPDVNNQANDELLDCPIYYSDEFPEYLFIFYNNSFISYKQLGVK